MKRFLGTMFYVLSIITYITFGLWGFVICLKIVSDIAGFWGIVIGITILPATFVAAPWYSLIVLKDWFPLLICYGGGIIGSLFYGIGSILAGNSL